MAKTIIEIEKRAFELKANADGRTQSDMLTFLLSACHQDLLEEFVNRYDK